MADEPVVTPAVTQGNETAARTETGEIKDQQTTQPAGSANQDTKPETKPSDTTAQAKPEAKPDSKGPPDKYTLTAPEGYEVDPKLVEEATPIFKKLGLDQAGAQALTDLWNKHSIAAAEEANKAYETLRTDWRNKTAADPTLGDGKDNLKPEVRANISRAIDALGDAKVQAAFKEAMDTTGVGDNPAFVSAMNTFGKLFAEGTLVRGTAPSTAGQTAPGSKPPSAARALFPNLPSSANP